MVSIFNINSFQEQFVSGLLYSILEGLKPSEVVVIKSKNKEGELFNELSQAQLGDLQLSKPFQNGDCWEMTITKGDSNESRSSCCGVCGIGD